MKKNLIIGAASLIAVSALLFIACNNDLSSPKVGSGETGTLIVQLGGEERTLAPAASALAGLTYKLLILQDGNIRVNQPFSAAKTILLQADVSYDVLLEAYNSDGNPVARRTASVTLKVGKTTRLNMTLVPVYYSDVYGTFTYTVDYPDADDEKIDISYSEAKMTLKPVTDGGTNPNGYTFDIDFNANPDTKKGTLTLPPGCYEMTIAIRRDLNITGTTTNANKPSVIRKEIVYIYPGLTTNASYSFTLEDFIADLRFFGTAEITNTPTDYQPVEVQAKLRKDTFNYTGEAAGKAAIVKNSETGKYEWELFVPAHYLQEKGNLSSIDIRFKAQNTKDSKKTFLSAWHTPTIKSVQGYSTEPIELTATYVTLKRSSALNILPGAGGKVENPDVVARGGYAEVIITTPNNYMLKADTVKLTTTSTPTTTIIYDSVNGVFLNGSSLDKNGNTITAMVFIPTNAADPILDMEFFQLKGTIIVPTGIGVNPSGFTNPVITAYDQENILIGTNNAVLKTGTTWDYEIPIPKGYIWWNNTSNGSVKVTMTATGRSDYVSLRPVTFSTNGYTPLDFSTTLKWTSITNTTFTAEQNTENGYLSSVTLSWNPVEYGGYYLIERQTGTGGYTPLAGAGNLPLTTTSFTDEAPPAIQALNNNVTTLQYRITVKDAVNSAYDSVNVSVSPGVPDSTTLTLNAVATPGNIATEGQQNVYYYENSTSTDAYFSGTETTPFDARFTIYNATTKAQIITYTGDKTVPVGTTPLIIVVQAWNFRQTGNYTVRVQAAP
jgi:hypothetical protein